MPQRWRLLELQRADAAWNMAVDRAIQIQHARGDGPPTLRLYRWTRPSATLGRFQDVAGVDVTYCKGHGIDVARRYTGGRGVLHDHEVTYAVIAGVRDGIPRGVTASYRYLCTALADAYRRLGVEASLTERARGAAGSSACYLHATNADLSIGAAKLSGSAQVWHESTCLQHGSFVVARDIDREAAVFRLDAEAVSDFKTRTATLDDVLSRVPSDEQIATAVTAAFSEVLGADVQIASLTSEETVLAEELVAETCIVSVED